MVKNKFSERVHKIQSTGRTVLTRRGRCISSKRKGYEGADTGRFSCLMVGCSGTSSLCPVFFQKQEASRRDNQGFRQSQKAETVISEE